MNSFAVATKTAIEEYRKSALCRRLCGVKPYGSRHWEYPWAVEQSGMIEKRGQRVLDVAPDLTFPYAGFLKTLGHDVLFIDIEKRKWSDTVTWGLDPELAGEGHIAMDVRHLAFADESFDVILCISVLEHIVCPTQDPEHPGLPAIFDPLGARPALKEMRRCLKPGGKLLLTVDIYGGPKWKDLFSKWDIFSDMDEAGFPVRGATTDASAIENMFRDPETFKSCFHGPYITIGFHLVK